MAPNCLRFVVALSGLLMSVTQGVMAAQIKDTESATHGFDAARHQVVQTLEFPGYKVVQINLPVLSHYSYVVVSGKEALVVDPSRDVTTYLDMAAKDGLTIKGVYLTHSHADFVAGHLELVKAVGCPVYQSAKSGAGYPIQPLEEGTSFRIGTAVLKAMETPAHTPDGTCAAVYRDDSAPAPDMVFTGDTLFVGGVGRPDLIEGEWTAARLASMGFDTWTQKLSKLPDSVVVLPAHGAGSLCGAHLSDDPSSTIGRERQSNPYLQHTARGAYVAAVLEGLAEPPQYFGHDAAMNRKGPALVDWAAPLVEVEPNAALTDIAKYYVIDIRDAGDYAAGHIPNSVNIALRGRFETWTGIMTPWGSNVVLVGEPEDLKEAVHRLHRIGYAGSVITMAKWRAAGQPIATNLMIEPRALYEAMQREDAPLVVDVRLPNEWMALRIGTVVNMPLNRLPELSAKLDSTKPVVAVCNSAYRSSLAVGVLERRGFTLASSLAGGSEAWVNAGLPVFGAQPGAAAAAAPPQRVVQLADRISPSDLNLMILDLPGAFDLVDIRPPAAYGDFSLPGSTNVNVADLLSNPAYLTGAGPLVIVDRDGSLAMMAGGILSQKTKRAVKVLHGGVEAYWEQSRLHSVVKEVPLGASGPRMGPAAPATPHPSAAPPSPEPQPATPQPPKKKSAGC